MKKSKGFHTPFDKLKNFQPEPLHPPAPPTPKPASRPTPPDEDTMFSQAMAGVARIEDDHATLATPDNHPAPRHVNDATQRENAEVLHILNTIVGDSGQFEVSATGEHIEAHAVSIDPQTMIRLRKGDFAVQQHLDLHGLSRDAAHEALTRSICNAHAMGDRCLLVIHGRGLQSDRGPVIKNQISRWLTTGNLSRLVLAFCSARPCDGGTGALYILLRKRPRQKHNS